MSKETMEWLNRNVLIGITDKRGKAWHYSEALQGTESNHYPGFIPVGDIERRLFATDPAEGRPAVLKPVLPGQMTLTTKHDNFIEVDGRWYEVVIDLDHKAIFDPDTNVVFDYPTTDYALHTYRQWLLKNVATILDADLGATSAGKLRRGAQAWVEVSMPENVDTPEGVTFRPNLLAFTSLDRSLSTTYKRTIYLVVCDNTLQARIGEEGETFKVKHTANSLGRVQEARQALNIIYKAGEDFMSELHEFCSITVTERQWQQVLEVMVPMIDVKGEKKEGRSLTLASNKRDKLDEMYRYDKRCSPWQGTKFGVIQTCNTFNFHESIIRNTHGGGRVERNQLKVLSSQAASVDNYVAQLVDDVLSA